MSVVKRIVSRFKEANDDLWLDREDIAKLCPSCADKMASLGIRKVRASVIFNNEHSRCTATPSGS